jgi:hypothetical protein
MNHPDNFTKRLYKDTKDYHTQVDRHPFVQLIRKNTDAAKLYINFNKICIYKIETAFLKKKTKYNNFISLFTRLQKNININDIDMNVSENLQILLKKCEEYPLEHSYMFYLGLMMGYKILDKYVKDDILAYDDSKIKLLIKDFKDFLDNNVEMEDLFINIVSESYILIKNVFDEYSIKYKNTI